MKRGVAMRFSVLKNTKVPCTAYTGGQELQEQAIGNKTWRINEDGNLKESGRVPEKSAHERRTYAVLLPFSEIHASVLCLAAAV